MKFVKLRVLVEKSPNPPNGLGAIWESYIKNKLGVQHAAGYGDAKNTLDAGLLL